jgi:hypothetical protein
MDITRCPFFTTSRSAFGLAGAPRINRAHVQLTDSVAGGRLCRGSMHRAGEALFPRRPMHKQMEPVESSDETRSPLSAIKKEV